MDKQVVVVKTADSWMGHAAVAVNEGGALKTVVDSAFGKGRIIPPDKYGGYVKPD